MPRWSTSRNAFTRGEDVTPVAAAARTANGNSGWLDALAFGQLSLTLAITAVGGDSNETLDVKVETASDSSGTNARDVASFAQATQPGGATTQRKTFAGLDDYYRVSWTVGGTTPAFTFGVSGTGK